MARIAGINIPPQQHAEIGLTAIYGIGRSRSRLILEQCGIPCTKKVQDLTDAELERIRDAVSKFTVEGDLRREVQLLDQALDRPRHLSRHASSPRSALPWSAYPHQRSHPQGPA